jgi:hypothetical protein
MGCQKQLSFKETRRKIIFLRTREPKGSVLEGAEAWIIDLGGNIVDEP